MHGQTLRNDGCVLYNDKKKEREKDIYGYLCNEKKEKKRLSLFSHLNSFYFTIKADTIEFSAFCPEKNLMNSASYLHKLL